MKKLLLKNLLKLGKNGEVCDIGSAGLYPSSRLPVQHEEFHFQVNTAKNRGLTLPHPLGDTEVSPKRKAGY